MGLQGLAGSEEFHGPFMVAIREVLGANGLHLVGRPQTLQSIFIDETQ